MSVAHQRHLPLPALIYETFDKFQGLPPHAADPGPKIGPRALLAPIFFSTQYGYADSRRPSKSFLEAGLAEAGLVEDGMVEPVFPGALARLQIGNS